MPYMLQNSGPPTWWYSLHCLGSSFILIFLSCFDVSLGNPFFTFLAHVPMYSVTQNEHFTQATQINILQSSGHSDCLGQIRQVHAPWILLARIGLFFMLILTIPKLL